MTAPPSTAQEMAGRSSPLSSPKMSRARRQAPPPSSSLKLPGLPRYHPANYVSPCGTGVANTPASGINSPQPPMSPFSQQRQYSAAQMHLFAYQREIMAATRGGVGATKPASPKLQPLAESPGPMTPLELEGAKEGGYLMVGSGAAGASSGKSQKEYVDHLIRKERGELSPGRSATKFQ